MTGLTAKEQLLHDAWIDWRPPGAQDVTPAYCEECGKELDPDEEVCTDPRDPAHMCAGCFQKMDKVRVALWFGARFGRARG